MSGSQHLSGLTLLRSPLDVFFTPRSVAVIGATEKPGSVGRTVLANLQASQFGGPVFPVNPNHATILGATSHPRIGDIRSPVDLAVVLTPVPES
jgi:acetyltransferase